MGDRGNELKSFSNKKLKECKELCESVSGCTSITYEDSTLVCKLRDKIFTTDETFEDGRYDGEHGPHIIVLAVSVERDVVVSILLFK